MTEQDVYIFEVTQNNFTPTVISNSDKIPVFVVFMGVWSEHCFKSDEFMKMWEFYLCYCEGGFIERVISDVHMLLVKPDNRCQHLL